MAKGVSKNDYKASAAELANAQVAQSSYADWKQNYQPLLKKRGEDTQTEAIKTTLRGRGNADAMQKLSATSIGAVQDPSYGSDVADGVVGQLGEANKVARSYQNDMGADTLARARQMQGTAQQGLSAAARLGVSQQLAKAAAKQEVATAKWNAVAKIGSAYVGQGMENMSQGPNGEWHTPGIVTGANEDGSPIYRKAESIGDYWQAGTARNFRS